MTKRRRLTPWASNVRLVSLYAATGLLRDTHAQSVLLVGPYGQGKTALLDRFRLLPTAKRLSDLTQMGIRTVLSRDTDRRIRHFSISEFDRLFARDRGVVATTLGLLTNLMTGDVGMELIGPQEFDFSGRQIGVLAAMTTDQFRKHREYMDGIGLLSRFQVLYVDRSDAERDRVRRNIVFQNAADLTPIEWPELFKERRVTYNARRFAPWFHRWLSSHRTLPHDERFTARLLILVRACALLNRHDRVTWRDFDYLREFMPYFAGERFVTLEWPPSRYGRPVSPKKR
jgi:hypothetical protein